MEQVPLTSDSSDPVELEKGCASRFPFPFSGEGAQWDFVGELFNKFLYV